MARKKKADDNKPTPAAPPAATEPAASETEAAADEGDTDEGEDDDGPADEEPEAEASPPAPSPAAPSPAAPPSHASGPPQPTEEQKREAAKKPQRPTPTRRERSAAATREQALAKELEETKHALVVANRRIRELERDIGRLQLAPGGPAVVRAMTPTQVRERLQLSPATKFRVLADYAHMNAKMIAGRVLEGRHYTNLVAHVQNGLKLALSE